jgi:hypothetical protein
MERSEKSFNEWSFVEKGFDQEHWYIKLSGGIYHGVVYKYESIKLNETTESIDYDYEIIDYLGDDPHGEPGFNRASGEILRSILDDAMDKQDFIVGDKDGRAINNIS